MVNIDILKIGGAMQEVKSKMAIFILALKKEFPEISMPIPAQNKKRFSPPISKNASRWERRKQSFRIKY